MVLPIPATHVESATSDGTTNFFSQSHDFTLASTTVGDLNVLVIGGTTQTTGIEVHSLTIAQAGWNVAVIGNDSNARTASSTSWLAIIWKVREASDTGSVVSVSWFDNTTGNPAISAQAAAEAFSVPAGAFDPADPVPGAWAAEKSASDANYPVSWTTPTDKNGIVYFGATARRDDITWVSSDVYYSRAYVGAAASSNTSVPLFYQSTEVAGGTAVSKALTGPSTSVGVSYALLVKSAPSVNPSIVSWSGAGLADGAVTSGNVTSQAGTGDSAPTNIIGSALAIASERLKYDQGAAVADYLKFAHTAVANWSVRARFTTPAAWGASTAALPFQAVSGSTLRVRPAITPTGNLRLQKAGGVQIGSDSTGVIPNNTEIYIKMWAVLDATVGEAHCVVVDASDAVLATVDVTGQNLGGTADQTWLGALATSPTLGTFYIDDFQVYNSATMPDTPGGTGGGGTPSPSGAIVAVLGDSLTNQGGTGVTNIKNSMSAIGYSPDNVLIDGLNGRTLTSGSDGRTVNQCIDDLLASAGRQPAVWIIALGTNNLNSSSSWASGIAGIVSKLEAVSPGVPVKWINVGIRSDIDAQDTRVEDFNAALASGLSGHASFAVADWNAYVHNGRDESNPNLWNLNDSTGYHMAPAGWTLRSDFYASSAGAPSTTAVDNWLSLSPFYCAHRGGSANWVEETADAYVHSSAWNPDLALEFSAVQLSDGTWVGSHDTTADRMFGTSGYTFSAHPWAGDAENLRTTIGGYPLMLLTDFLDTYANGSRVVFVDPKAGSVTNFLDICDAHGGPGNIVVKCYGASTSIGDAAGSRGYQTWGFMYQADEANIATWATHYSLLGMQYDATTAWTTILAQGKPVLGHIINSSAAATTAFNQGADGLMVSDVLDVVPSGNPTQAITPSSRASSLTVLAPVLSTSGAVSITPEGRLANRVVNSPSLAGTGQVGITPSSRASALMVNSPTLTSGAVTSPSWYINDGAETPLELLGVWDGTNIVPVEVL